MSSRLISTKHYFLYFLFSTFCVSPFLVLSQPSFTDVTEEAAINHSFKVFQGTFGGGAAVIDYNMDGWEDLFIAGGAGPDQLLLNQKDGTFKNVGQEAFSSVLDGFVTQGAAVADVNKDGWPDLFVTTIAFVFNNGFKEAPNVLLINNKDGTFLDESLDFRLIEKTFSTGASFGDVNRDGYPDLYVSNYFENFEGSLDEFTGPQTNGDTAPGKDLLYINNGGQSFIESSGTYGIERPGLGFQGLWSDFDNDNDLDLLVANDFGNRTTPNLLYRNDYPEQKFTEIGEEINFNYGINAMGFSACDVNQDGWMDYLVSNIQVSPFFINQGAKAPFIEESEIRGSGFASIGTENGTRITPVSWGVNFFDSDHDMDYDLYITNGSLNPGLAPNPNLLLENVEGFFFQFGFDNNTDDQSIGRGSVVFDYDNDGDYDLFVVNQGPYQEEDIGIEFKGSRLFRNDNASQNNWIKIKLKGNRSDSNGIGSRIEVYVGETMLIQEIYGGSSHESQNSTIAHFGLGDFETIDSIKVKWSASEVQQLENISTKQLLTIEEENKEVDNGPIITEKTVDINVYPVPFSDHIFLDVPAEIVDKPAVLLITDAIGQYVLAGTLSSLELNKNRIQLDASWSPGVYLLSLEGDGFSYSKKLMKLE